MEKAVIYARYSSHSQTEQSIEGQLSAAHKYAELHGYTVIKEYCDRAKTGTNDNREEFQLMLHDCAKKQFSVVIVWKVDRFGRNREEIAFNKHHCKKYGVRIEYVAENISDGPEGVILESVLEGMAEYYSLQLSQNIKRGHLETAKKYKPINGNIALGYRVNKDREYEIDPDGAELVRTIYKKYLSGMSLMELTNWLNEHGYKTSKGNDFTKNSLPRIFENEMYIGTYKYKDLVYAENVVPAIIDKATFNKAKEMMVLNRHRTCKNWNYADYLLSGKLICSECGEYMTGTSGTSKTGRKYNYYKCKNDTNRIPQFEVEQKILDAVNLTILNDEGISFLTDAVYNYAQKEDEIDREIRRLDKEISSITTAIDNLLKAVERGMEYDLVKERVEDLYEKRNGLVVVRANQAISHPLKLTKEQIRYFLDQFRNKNINDRKVQRSLIDTFVNSVIYSPERTLLALNYKETQEKSNVFEIANGSVRPCWLEWSLANSTRTPLQYCIQPQNIILRMSF